MSHRRTIGLAVALALFAGQTLLPLERAACGMPRGGEPPACPSCAADRGPQPVSLNADRSCCRVSTAAPDREPATVVVARFADGRQDLAAFIAPTPTASARLLGSGALEPRGAPPSRVDSPRRNTTVLLI
jgi:hypothetical protein